jgi:glycosyltransferase involved in cell wall biosynthesis
MKILQLHNRQLMRGGADSVVEREAAALTRRGHEVRQLFADNADVERIGTLRSGMKAIWNLEMSRRLRADIRTFRPDVVHVHTPFPIMSPAVFRVAHAEGVRTVATVHSFRYSCVAATFLRDGKTCTECIGKTLKTPAVRHRCYKGGTASSAALAAGLSLHHSIGTLRHRVDLFLALTQFMADRLIEDGIPPDRVTMKPNFVPDIASSTRGRDGSILFAGRLVPEKGVHTLLNGWELIDQPLKLTIVGDGPMRQEVESAARRNDNIDFRGWLDPPQLHALLAQAAAVVVPSTWHEAGVPLSVLESFSAGTPVITSDLPNLSEAVTPGENGVRFRTGDPTSLAKAIVAIAEDSDPQRLRLGARATFLRRYSEDLVMRQLEGLYRLVIGQAERT